MRVMCVCGAFFHFTGGFMAQYDGSIRINTNINTKGLKGAEKDIRGSMDRISGAARKMAAVIGSAFAIGKLVQFGKEALALGSDLEEVQNVVDVTFTTMSNKVNEFAKNAARAAGLSETMAKQYVGTFGAMAKSFGFTEQQAYDMSTALTQLSGDVASFYNITQDEAYTKLKSVFTGETETLKELGVVMTQNALDSYAMAKGYKKTTAKMTEQEKVALRYRFVMDQLSGATGDFTRTSDSWANQVRIFKLQIDSLKATIGQGLVNIFTPIIKAINAFISRLSVAAEAFKSFTSLITGGKTQTGGSGMASGYGKAADEAERLADANNDVAASTKKAAKETQKALAPFDDLRQIQFEEAEQSENLAGEDLGIGMGIDLGQAMDTQKAADNMDGLATKFASAIDAMKQKAKELKDIFMAGFWDGLGDYKPRLEELKSDLQKIGGYLKDIFTDADVHSAASRFVNSFVYMIGTFVGSLASIGLTIATNIVGGIESYLSGNVERIKAWIIRMFDVGTEINVIFSNFFIAFADVFSTFASQTAQDITGSIIQIFADVFGGILELTLKFTRDVLNMMLTPFVENKDKIKEALMQTLEPIKVAIQGIASAVRNAVDKIVALYDDHIHPFFESIKDGLSELLGKVLDAYTDHIVPILDKLGAKFKEVMEGPVGDAINSAINFIGKLVDTVKWLWEEAFVPFIGWIIDNILPVIAPILETLGELILNFSASVADLISGILDVLSGLIDFVVGVFSLDWEKAWDGVKQIFESVWDLITKSAQTGIENIKSLISGLLNTVKEAAKAIASLFEGKSASQALLGNASKFGKSISISRSEIIYPESLSVPNNYKIPALASGTVVPPNREFMAVLGDNKREPEVVSPISTMKQAVIEALKESGVSGGNDGRPIYITMEVKGQQFASLVYQMNNQEKQRVGVRMVAQNG